MSTNIDQQIIDVSKPSKVIFTAVVSLQTSAKIPSSRSESKSFVMRWKSRGCHNCRNDSGEATVKTLEAKACGGPASVKRTRSRDERQSKRLGYARSRTGTVPMVGPTTRFADRCPMSDDERTCYYYYHVILFLQFRLCCLVLPYI